MGERAHDREDLDETMRIVRERVPGAVAIDLETTDQDTVGFILRDVVFVDGAILSNRDPAVLDAVADDVWHLVSSLGWDGLVGENDGGYGRVVL